MFWTVTSTFFKFGVKAPSRALVTFCDKALVIAYFLAYRAFHYLVILIRLYCLCLNNIIFIFFSVLMFCMSLCCSVCLFLYGPFCHSALKIDLSTLFTAFFLWTSHQYIFFWWTQLPKPFWTVLFIVISLTVFYCDHFHCLKYYACANKDL